MTVRASFHDNPRGGGSSWLTVGTSDVSLSGTAGTYTDVIVSGSLSCTARRLYQVTVVPASYLTATGSGFATGDTWRLRLRRNPGGAGYADLNANRTLRSNVAIGSVIPVAPLIGYYSPATSAGVVFKLDATKSTGAGTVSSTLSVDGGAGAFTLLVQDIGPAGAALN